MSKALTWLIALAAVASTVARAQEAMPIKTVALVKEATVYIRTAADHDGNGPAMSGSGFVIRVEGTTGYVVTNAHVVTPSRGDLFSGRPTTKVFFRSGTKAEVQAVAEVVACDPERDLAVLEVTKVSDLPKPIAVDAKDEPYETMTVYIFGFPFGEKLAMGKGNPPVNVARGQVSSIRRNEDDRLTSVLLDGALNPGNSGGPVVDTKGDLIGVSRATIRGANIGFAIAAPALVEMLAGRARGATLVVKSVHDGKAELSVAVPLLDPLDRVKSVRLLHARGATKFSKKARAKSVEIQPKDDDDDPPAQVREDTDEDSTFGPIEVAQTLALRLEKHTASGRFEVPLSDGSSLWCQPSIVNGAGKEIHFRPRRYVLGASKRDPEAFTFWGEVVDPDGDCDLNLRGGELVFEVPGTLHDLNVDIGKNNAPRVVQEIDGDFTATVKVGGSFEPGESRTGPKSVPYNGGGLVIWHDEGNYIRLERASMYRNNRVVGFLAFESRERGTRTEVHNKGGLNPRQDCWLRIERRGETISGSLSDDGKDWEDLQPMSVDWPSRLKVGVDAVNSCGDPMTVKFQDYTLNARKDRAPDAGR